MVMQNTIRGKGDQRVIIFLRFFLIRWLTKESWNRWRESILVVQAITTIENEETRMMHVIRFDVVNVVVVVGYIFRDFNFLTNLKFREY